jgi:hypothetical protein
VDGQYYAPVALPPGKSRYPLYRRLVFDNSPQRYRLSSIKSDGDTLNKLIFVDAKLETAKKVKKIGTWEKSIKEAKVRNGP